MQITMTGSADSKKRKMDGPKIPVTLLGGFLGAGKSTLLKHILEAKREEGGDFKCAVIVNDMAELNIDKDLVESTKLVESGEVISMQNGCVCCSLSGDLVDRVVELAQRRDPKVDYILVEASGVSEPAAIAFLFGDDEGVGKAGIALGDAARLDSLVTVVDSAEFLRNLEVVDVGMDSADPEKRKQTPRLLVEQVEYANVVLLNKTDLVSEEQLEKVRVHISALNRRAKILTCKNSSVDVAEVVNTGLFNAADFDLDGTIELFSRKEQPKACCKAAVDKGESPCCLKSRTIDSGLSQVVLPSNKNEQTRHGEKYNITSFVYKARRPFRPSKFHEDFLDKFFTHMEEDDDDEDDGDHFFFGKEDDDDDEDDEGEKENDSDDKDEKKDQLMEEEASGGKEDKLKAEVEEAAMKKFQEDAAEKKAACVEAMGTVLRVKGFAWQASSHDIVGFVNVAGNVAKQESPGPWNALDKRTWTGTEAEKAKLRKNWINPWGDRRQELVFIGQDLKHEAIQKLLDSCLLDDDEMAIGVDGWKATFGDVFLESV